MRTIIRYIVSFLKNERHPMFYLVMAFFLIASFYINYHYNFENRIIESTLYQSTLRYFIYRLLSYAMPYYFTAILYAFCTRQYGFLKNPLFWIKSLMGLSLLVLSYTIIAYAPRFTSYFSLELHNYAWLIYTNSNRVLTIMLPLGLYYIFFERERSNFYGFKIKGVDLRPYLYMMLIMAPLIAYASFQKDFMESYPTFSHGINGYDPLVPLWQKVSYEVVYILDFITIEMLYRGLLVIGLAGIMGRAAVFPMVATYAFLHFGKPVLEAVGSIAGGFILGVIAYQTRSIFGGIIIHAGVALGMDTAAYAQIIAGRK